MGKYSSDTKYNSTKKKLDVQKKRTAVHWIKNWVSLFLCFMIVGIIVKFSTQVLWFVNNVPPKNIPSYGQIILASLTLSSSWVWSLAKKENIMK